MQGTGNTHTHLKNNKKHSFKKIKAAGGGGDGRVAQAELKAWRW